MLVADFLDVTVLILVFLEVSDFSFLFDVLGFISDFLQFAAFFRDPVFRGCNGSCFMHFLILFPSFFASILSVLSDTLDSFTFVSPILLCSPHLNGLD